MTKQASNSLERALALLELFNEQHQAWSPEELMNELGYSRPTLYRYLKTLKNAGLLSSTSQSKYTLGPKVAALDYVTRQSDPLVVHGPSWIEALTEAHPCTAIIARWYGNKILCVTSVNSAEIPLSNYSRGRPLPLNRGAMAKAILSFLPKRRRLFLLEENISELETVGTEQSVDELMEELRRFKKAGYATAYGELTPGLVGIASPIFDGATVPVASVGVTLSESSVSERKINAMATQVKQTASDISRAISEFAEPL